MHFFKCLTAGLTAIAMAPFFYGQEDEATERSASSPVATESAETAVAEASAQAETPAPEVSEKKAEPELTDAQKKQLEINLLSARKARLDAEIALERVLLAEKLSAKGLERSRIEAETALRKAKTAEKLAEIDANKRRLDAEVARDTSRDALTSLERSNKLRTAELDFKIAKAEQDLKVARYNREIARVKMAETMRGIAVPAEKTAQDYRKEPLENGKLYISDRRIEFDGVVTQDLAKYIAERIYLFNNQSAEYPIFLVIGNSPGGSVAAGYQILKAMESSRAPVFVVVKGSAASMAAVITTLASRSFCYSGTVLMHHQVSSEVKGNITQMTEGLKQVSDYTREISNRLAAKMGLTYDEMVKEMYAHNSRGDWSEFGDGAKKWNWVTDIVETIDESSIITRGDGNPTAAHGNVARGNVGETKIDERGKPYVELPTLSAGDAWLIYDPANFYRVAR